MSNETKAKAEHAMSILDALADKWVEEVNLTAAIKNAASPMKLNRNAPDDVRASFTNQMEAQIYAIARQAFIEGAYRAICGLQDEKVEMRRLGLNEDDLDKAATRAREAAENVLRDARVDPDDKRRPMTI